MSGGWRPASFYLLQAREAKIPAQGKIRLTEALERLVQLYEATDKKDDAAKWRKELGKNGSGAQSDPK